MEKLTKEQAAIIAAYTGYHMGNFSAMQDLAESVMGRPVFTHEFGQPTFAQELHEKVAPLFLALCPDA